MSEGEETEESTATDDDDEPAQTPTADVETEELSDRLNSLEAERDELAERVEELEEERDDLMDRLKRTAADFENFKKRKERERERVKTEATEELVGRLLDVRDNLKRAVEQEADDTEVIREGVKLTLDEFDRVLDAEGVVEIDPEPGTAVDPSRHEVMLQVDSDQPGGHIAEVYQSGYAMGEKVLRPAQVTVSETAEEDNDDE